MSADTIVYRNAVLVINGASLETQFQELALDYGAEMLDRTTFGATTRERKGGLFTAQLDGKGFAQFGSNAIEDVLFGLVGGSPVPVVVFPDGITEASQTTRGYAMSGVVEKFNIGGAIGILLPIDTTIQASGYGPV